MSCDLWTEKYRPKTSDELDCEPHIKKFLENSIKNGFPHLLLYGPPGTGKTTFASLLKPTFQLNASDDRGIETIRNKIKTLANTVSKQIIVLDECENLTKDSQTCLRRILEDYPNTTFIFCTNYFSKIIDPLKSRLLKIKFTLKESKALEKIGKAEGINADPIFYKKLFEKCNKDLRRSLNVLQGIKPLKTFDIDDLTGVIKEEVLLDFKNISIQNFKNFIQKFINESYSVLQLIIQLSKKISLGNFFAVSDTKIADFSLILSDCEVKCLNGCSDEIVLTFLVLNYISIFSNK